jgi:multiple sugar transport system ATP-binding protein
MAIIKFNNIGKKYDSYREGVGREFAVQGVNLVTKENEFITIIGSSGCGKSTLLKMISGLESITTGTFEIDGKKVNDLSPKDRDIAMVFQSYALYPHLSIYDNIGFGLKLRNMPKDEIDVKVKEAAQWLGISDYLDSTPKDLSGGQQQRVALARAIVRKPTIFLMDEPLSNLDAKLRVSTRTKIRKIHDELGVNTFYVTHDQTEALTMSDRIVVVNDGIVQQIGTPREIYQKPANIWVAQFIGSVGINVYQGDVKAGKFISRDNVEFVLPAKFAALTKTNVMLGIRAESFSDEPVYADAYPEQKLVGKVDQVEYLGAEQFVYLNVPTFNKNNEEDVVATTVLKLSDRKNYQAGSEMEVHYNSEKIHLFDGETGESL